MNIIFVLLGIVLGPIMALVFARALQFLIAGAEMTPWRMIEFFLGVSVGAAMAWYLWSLPGVPLMAFFLPLTISGLITLVVLRRKRVRLIE